MRFRLLAFQLAESGSIRSPNLSSTGVTPFGFSVRQIADAILVSNAASGAANASSLRSYRFDGGTLNVLLYIFPSKTAQRNIRRRIKYFTKRRAPIPPAEFVEQVNQAAEHSGANFGYRSEYLRFPQQRFSAIVLCNLSSAATVGLAHKIADLYLQGNLAPVSAPRVSSGFPAAETFAGTYLDPQTKTIYKFTAEGGNLMGWGEPLQRVAAHQYYDLQGDIMTFANNNGVMRLTLPIPGEVYFSGDRLQPLQLSADELTRLVGDFHSEELDATYTLSVEGGWLRVKVPNNPPIPLDAAGPNEFCSSDLGDLVFHFDAGNRISAFTLSTQASRGIIFKKVN